MLLSPPLLLLLLLLLPDLKKVIGYPADQASQLLQVWKVRSAAASPAEQAGRQCNKQHILQCVCGQPYLYISTLSLVCRSGSCQVFT
jgi:hypothetical protein